VVTIVLDPPLKQNHVEWQQSIPDGEVMEHGAPALSNAVWEHKQEHVHVLVVMLVVLLALEQLPRQGHVEWQSLTPSMDLMEHGAPAL